MGVFYLFFFLISIALFWDVLCLFLLGGFLDYIVVDIFVCFCFVLFLFLFSWSVCVCEWCYLLLFSAGSYVYECAYVG